MKHSLISFDDAVVEMDRIDAEAASRDHAVADAPTLPCTEQELADYVRKQDFSKFEETLELLEREHSAR